MADRFSKGVLKQQAFNWAKQDMERLRINAPLVDLEPDGFSVQQPGVIFSLYHDRRTRETLFRADYSSGHTAYWRICNYDAIRFTAHNFVQEAENAGIAISQRFAARKFATSR